MLFQVLISCWEEKMTPRYTSFFKQISVEKKNMRPFCSLQPSTPKHQPQLCLYPDSWVTFAVFQGSWVKCWHPCWSSQWRCASICRRYFPTAAGSNTGLQPYIAWVRQQLGPLGRDGEHASSRLKMCWGILGTPTSLGLGPCDFWRTQNYCTPAQKSQPVCLHGI